MKTHIESDYVDINGDRVTETHTMGDESCGVFRFKNGKVIASSFMGNVNYEEFLAESFILLKQSRPATYKKL